MHDQIIATIEDMGRAVEDCVKADLEGRPTADLKKRIQNLLALLENMIREYRLQIIDECEKGLASKILDEIETRWPKGDDPE